MLATSALSPGEKTWFKNRTLLNYLPLAVFSHVTRQNQRIPVGKDVTKKHGRGHPYVGKRAICDPPVPPAGLGNPVYLLPTRLGRNG